MGAIVMVPAMHRYIFLRMDIAGSSNEIQQNMGKIRLGILLNPPRHRKSAKSNNLDILPSNK